MKTYEAKRASRSWPAGWLAAEAVHLRNHCRERERRALSASCVGKNLTGNQRAIDGEASFVEHGEEAQLATIISKTPRSALTAAKGGKKKS